MGDICVAGGSPMRVSMADQIRLAMLLLDDDNEEDGD